MTKDGFNLVASTDEWMSPVFAEVGPDGAVWFADWQNFIIQHNPTPSVQRGGYDATTGVGGAHENPLRDHERGRIYRVVWDGAEQPAITSLADAKPEALVEALGDDNQFWRLTAQRLLVEREAADAVPALKETVTAGENPIAALHALWTLHGLGALDEEAHLSALLAKDAGLRRNAVRALGADEAARELYFSSAVISDPNLITRLAALVKLSEFPTDEPTRNMIKSLAAKPEHASDEWLAEATRLLVRVHGVEAYREGPNLLPNADFELVGTDGLPEGWTRRDYQNIPGNEETVWSRVDDSGQARGGSGAVRVVAGGRADTSLYADVEYKPNTQYRLSAWVRSRNLRGRLSLNDHITRVETERMSERNGDWYQVEAVFNSGRATRGSINLLMVGSGEGWFDDVRLSELMPAEDPDAVLVAADPLRGREIFYKHPAACVLCHQVNGEGSTVGPALDGIASRYDDKFLLESLVEPSATMAPGFEQYELSPMPPMGDIFNAQELADIVAFLKTLE